MIGVEDAYAVDHVEKFAKQHIWAAERLHKHRDLEGQRMANGLKTDLQRYLDGEPITD